MKKRLILPLTVFALLVSFGLAACGGSNGQNEGSNASESSNKQQEKITVTAENNKKSLLFGESVQLTAKVGNVVLEGVTWESSKPDVVSVTQAGLASAVGKGSAAIKAVKEGYKDGTISISADYPSITLTAADNKTTLMYGESVQLRSSVDGVSWESSDPLVATVSNSGLVESVSKGSAVISAKKANYNDGTVTITVNYPNITISVAGDKTELELEEQVQLTASVENVTWESSNSNIVSVDNDGLVSAEGYGKAKITASKDRYNTAEVTITVVRPAPTAVLHMEDAEHYSADGSWSTDGRGPGTAGPVYSPSSGNPSDGTCIAYFGEGDKETLKFTADKAIEVELVLTVGYYYTINDLSKSIGAKFNDANLVIDPQTYESEGTTGYTYKQFSLGKVTLKNSENVLELTMLSGAEYYPYIDDLQFFAAEALNVAPVVDPTIEVEKDLVILEATETYQIDSDTTGLSYESSDVGVATVSDSGLITAVANGKAVITVSKDGMKPAKIIVGVGVESFAGEAKQIEVENCLFNGEITTRDASTGEKIINAWPKNASIIIAFKSSVAGKFDFLFNGKAGRSGYTSVDTNLETDVAIEVNGVSLSGVTGTVSGSSYVDYPIGEIDVINGLNIITITNLKTTGPSIDYFKLAPKA